MRVLEYGLIGTLLAGLAFVLLGLLLVRLSRRPPRPLTDDRAASRRPVGGRRGSARAAPAATAMGVRSSSLAQRRCAGKHDRSSAAPGADSRAEAEIASGGRIATGSPTDDGAERERIVDAVDGLPKRGRALGSRARRGSRCAQAQLRPQGRKVPRSRSVDDRTDDDAERAARLGGTARHGLGSAPPSRRACPATASAPTHPPKTKARRASPKAFADPQNTDTLATPVSSEPT